MLVTPKHLSKSFDNELHEVVDLFLQMGRMAAEQVMIATRALIAADETTAKKVIADDDLINQLEVKIDEQIILLVAKRQPAANDLRLVMALSKGIVDFERVGDEAEKIARMVRSIIQSGSPRSLPSLELRVAADLASGLLNKALDAFARLDITAAVAILKEDDLIDAEFDGFVRKLITYMMEDPRMISPSLDLLFLAKAIERIGDHAKNIAEFIIYVVKGEDVRHATMEKIESVIK